MNRLQKQCWKRIYCVCRSNVLHWFCFKVCRLCLVYIQYKLPCATRRNNSRKLRRYMLPIYGLVALTMLKPVHLTKINDGHAIFRMKLETCNWYSSSRCVYISLYPPSKKLTGFTRFGKTTSGKVFHTE